MYKESFPKNGWIVINALKDVLSKYNAVLAGGTALSLQIGHRMSVDLDFFTTANFKSDFIIGAIKRANLPFSVISEESDTFLVEINNTKFALFKYDYPFIDKTINLNGINLSGILDIAAMKIIAISQRGTKRDFVDLFFILKNVPLFTVADHLIKRFGRERINAINIGKSFVYFTDAESDPEPKYLKGNETSWKTVKLFFKKHVKQFVFDLDEV